MIAVGSAGFSIPFLANFYDTYKPYLNIHENVWKQAKLGLTGVWQPALLCVCNVFRKSLQWVEFGPCVQYMHRYISHGWFMQPSDAWAALHSGQTFVKVYTHRAGKRTILIHSSFRGFNVHF